MPHNKNRFYVVKTDEIDGAHTWDVIDRNRKCVCGCDGAVVVHNTDTRKQAQDSAKEYNAIWRMLLGFNSLVAVA